MREEWEVAIVKALLMHVNLDFKGKQGNKPESPLCIHANTWPSFAYMQMHVCNACMQCMYAKPCWSRYPIHPQQT